MENVPLWHAIKEREKMLEITYTTSMTITTRS